LRRPDIPLGPLTRRDDEPAFDEAWQAQILGIADALVTSGAIAPDAWAQALGAALHQHSEAGDADSAETYYSAVLDAVEKLLAASGDVTPGDVAAREEQWRRAYLNTPHGQPVEFSAGTKEPS
jgi:hypothetical protein